MKSQARLNFSVREGGRQRQLFFVLRKFDIFFYMLGNTRIRQLVTDCQLIDNFNEECLRNCSYRLRVGKLIKPGGAEVLDFNPEDKKNNI